MKRLSSVVLRSLSVAGLLLASHHASIAKAVNLGPPSSPILNLSGSGIGSSLTKYTATFTATNLFTAITFDFRQDTDVLSFANVSVRDVANPGRNLLKNGDLASGIVGTNVVDDWVYAYANKTLYGGVLESGCGLTAADNCWQDGSVQGYDSLSQTIATVVGRVYEVSFWLAGGASSTGFYSAFSNNGYIDDMRGDGNNVTVYASLGQPMQTSFPPPVPETPTWAMMLGGFGGLALLGFLKARRKPASA